MRNDLRAHLTNALFHYFYVEGLDEFCSRLAKLGASYVETALRAPNNMHTGAQDMFTSLEHVVEELRKQVPMSENLDD